MTGIETIAEERQRQIKVEGWTPEHDDEYINEELTLAGLMYAIPQHSRILTKRDIPLMWPWEPEWWKPTPNDRIKELAKAGALIAAEIDRLNRKNNKT